MNNPSARPIQFRNYLPEAYRGDDTGSLFQDRFLKAFEEVFEELQNLIEGVSPGNLRLSIDSDPLGLCALPRPTATICVEALAALAQTFPKGSIITRKGSPSSAKLAQDLPAGISRRLELEVDDPLFVVDLRSGDRLEVIEQSGQSQILIFLSVEKIQLKVRPPVDSSQTFPKDTFVTAPQPETDSTNLVTAYPGKAGPAWLLVRDADFARAVLKLPNSEVILHAGGIPDLFNPDLTPPPQFGLHQPPDEETTEPDFPFLNFLAAWIGLPLRDELIRRTGETDPEGHPPPDDRSYLRRKARWNRHLLRTAAGIYPRRGTLNGVKEMLRAWLKDDLAEGALMVTDLLRPHTDIDAVFQLGHRATLGVETVLGEGPPFFFIADLMADPTVPGLRTPHGIDILLREAKFILDSECPAHAYYQLRVRARTMQLAPPLGKEHPDEIYAQIGQTAQLWQEPALFHYDPRSPQPQS